MTADRSRSDGDDKPGSSMQLAAVMLRRGDVLATVAERTGVPVPLLELLQEEQSAIPRRRVGPGAGTGEHAVGRQRPVVEFFAVCAITVCVTARIDHQYLLSVASGGAAAALIVAVWLLIRRSRLPGHAHQKPRRTRNPSG